MKVVLVGAGGQLGRTIADRWSGRHEIVPLTRATIDVTDYPALERRVIAEQPEVIVNCAAYNAVDAAEDDPETALAVNALAVRSLATAASRAGAMLVHYGTDFVFDGRTTRPYTEEDAPSPESAYGASKLAGEWFAAGAPRHLVLRVESLFGGPHRRSSIDRIVEVLVSGGEARVFSNRVVTPSYVDDVADATEALVQRGAAPGVYHCVNSGQATWLELGEEVLAALEPRPAGRLVPVKVADVPMKARRPQYCALSNAKLRAAGVSMPDWRDAVRRYLAQGPGIRHQAPGIREQGSGTRDQGSSS